MTISKPAWRVIAALVAVTLLCMATRVDVYHATSPEGVSRTLFGPHVFKVAHPPWLSLHVWLRKTYSVIAFAIVGYATHRALNPTARPALRAAILVAIYSLSIEVAQRIFVGPEPSAENLLDVACGALGGWLAIAADRWLQPNTDAIKRKRALQAWHNH